MKIDYWMKRRVIVLILISLMFFNIILGFYRNERIIYGEDIIEKLDGRNENVEGENLENIENFEGELEVVIREDIQKGFVEYLYSIRTQEGSYRLNSVPENMNLVSGMQISVSGILKENSVNGENEVDVKDFSLIGNSQQFVVPVPVVGVKNVTFFRVKFLDDQTDFLSEEDAEILMNDINSYYKENSYNQMSLNYSIYPEYITFPFNSDIVCSIGSSINPLRDFIINDPTINNNINWLEVDNLIIAWGRDICPAWAAISDLGEFSRSTADGITKFGTVNLDGPNGWDFTIAHELGHNYKLDHADYLDCLGDHIYLPFNGCDTINYGDQFDVMGNSTPKGHFSAIHKEKLGWLNPNQIINNPTGGIYFITPLEISGGTKAIKIAYDGPYSYYLEYRRPTGYDFYLPELYGLEVYGGVFLHINELYGSGGFKSDTQLLDNTPLNDEFDVVVRPDKPFVDFIGQEIFTVRNFNSSGVEVIIGATNCNNGADGLLSGNICNGCVSQAELENYIGKYYIDYTEITQISGSIKTYLIDLQNPTCP